MTEDHTSFAENKPGWFKLGIKYITKFQSRPHELASNVYQNLL
jgi:hypothetical protein